MMVGVILAAGAGARLGRGPKALLDFSGDDEKQTQVERTVATLRAGGCDDIVVVVGAEDQRVRDLLSPGTCRVIYNPDWATGLASSFKAGIRVAERLLDSRPEGAIMVALIDQPDVNDRVVAHLKKAASPTKVVAAGYQDEDGTVVRGHPVVFPVAMARAAAAEAHGDEGARRWLQERPQLVKVVDVRKWATGRDIDTPEDLRQWRERGQP
ncbi:NTP transferase domain-containing protein [Corynebacterium sp.]|uniref:nucleotidyltransferase family protein n=1 Tax=Corynebacterium sp. TaxID=1720 RepID=UPI00373518FD